MAQKNISSLQENVQHGQGVQLQAALVYKE
jgi:hypothetical protein